MMRLYGPALLALLAATAEAQEKKDAPAVPKKQQKQSPFKVSLEGLPKLNDTSRYLASVAKLREIVKQEPALNQALAAEEAFVGRHKAAMELMDMGRKESPAPKNTDSLDKYEPKDAAETILALANKHHVVMINEAHHVARHRAFATLLLDGLRERGFTYFAAETFGSRVDGKGNDTENLARRKYPTLATGYYSNEPFFGDLVRTAMRLGFKPVAYEHHPTKQSTLPDTPEGWMKQIAEREEGQAKNLIDGIFKKEPNAKVVVFVGYSHARETMASKDNPVEWMAAKLKRATGIDPLTVDQAEVMEHSKPGFEHPAYRIALEKKKTSHRPWVLCDPKAGDCYVPSRDRGAFDLTVFHPRDEYEGGRPTWVRMGGYRKPAKGFELPAAPAKGSLLLQAFPKGEDMNVAVPIDQVEYAVGDPMPTLMLPKGNYVVRVVDSAEKGKHQSEVTVE